MAAIWSQSLVHQEERWDRDGQDGPQGVDQVDLDPESDDDSVNAEIVQHEQEAPSAEVAEEGDLVHGRAKEALDEEQEEQADESASEQERDEGTSWWLLWREVVGDDWVHGVVLSDASVGVFVRALVEIDLEGTENLLEAVLGSWVFDSDCELEVAVDLILDHEGEVSIDLVSLDSSDIVSMEAVWNLSLSGEDGVNSCWPLCASLITCKLSIDLEMNNWVLVGVQSLEHYWPSFRNLVLSWALPSRCLGKTDRNSLIDLRLQVQRPSDINLVAIFIFDHKQNLI